MQHMNDDMDELFRKAADDYPLRVNTPDWNKIQEALDGNVIIEPTGKKKYRRFTWLLLLLPLGFLFYYISGSDINDSGKLGSNSDSNKSPSTSMSKADVSNTDVTKTDVSKTDRANTDISGSDGSGTDVSTKEVSGTDVSKSDVSKTDKAKEDVSSNIQNADKADRRPLKAAGLKKVAPEKVTPNFNKSKADRLQSRITNDEGNDYKHDRNNVTNNISKRTVTPLPETIPSDRSNVLSNTIPVKDQNGRRNTVSGSDKLLNDGLIQHGLIDGVSKTDISNFNDDPGLFPFTSTPQIIAMTRLPIEPINDPAHFDGMQLSGKRELPPVRKAEPKFYVGAIGGLDITSVRLQKFSNPGSHYGAIAGFQFSNKWSVEAGFFVERKFYYTDGKYFDKRRMNYNPNSKILSIEGVCKMFEIPLSVKYDIRNTFRSTWFVTGGLSSYIMKTEDYDMLYKSVSSGAIYPHSYTYKNSSKNFFSEVRLTGGYSYKIRSNFSLRIEPYLNIPVSGVGYGRLRLMSAGVNAGIFKRIF